VRWFRLYHEFATDPKVQSLSEADQRRYVMLLCLRCRGDIKKLSENELAWALNISVDKLLITKRILIENRFITKKWHIVGWNKSQRRRLHESKWGPIRTQIFERDDYTCQYCGDRGGQLECDHVVPLSRGGPDTLDNLLTACFQCNRSKGSKTLEEWNH